MANTTLGAGGSVMQALKTRMHWNQTRQKLLAENVANADSPGFRPRDLKAPAAAKSGVALAQTSPAHMGPSGQQNGFDGTAARRFEITPRGNAVNLEDEMLKVAQNQGEFQLAASLYSKSLGLMKIAIGKGR